MRLYDVGGLGSTWRDLNFQCHNKYACNVCGRYACVFVLAVE